MYFIARNNKIYNYIAHTSLRRCYMATFFALSIFIIGGIYFVYYPLLAHIALLQSERVMLQKKSDDIIQLDKTGQELADSVESSKKNIMDHGVFADKREEHCHQCMSFVLDTISQLGLTLNAYGSCNTKDKDWYIKNSAHFDITGPIQKLMTFLETIKNSRFMITVSQVKLTRVSDDAFQMGCDIGLVMVKK